MVSQLPLFLSLVITTRNHAEQIQPLLTEASRMLSKLVSDHEIVIVDNASNDDSLVRLKALTGADGLPNLQIYALTKEVDADTASWVGLENALGDFVAVIDPLNDDISFLPEMLEKAVSGADVVFAKNLQKPAQGFVYRGAYAIFNLLYKWFSGIHLAKEAPQYRVLSKRIVNFILQHPQPAMTYRHLPATGGFARVNLSYSAAPGWVSLSLQQSGMFFLISLVLLVLGEYILNMVSLQNDGPLYHVGQEFTSARMTRREKLNIEEVMSPLQKVGPYFERVGQ